MKKFILMMLAAGSFIVSLAQDDWELQKEEDGIKVYTRLVEGSPIKAFKAEALMKGKLSSFIAVLKDVESFPELFSSNKYAQLIEESDTSLLQYSQTAIPWPMKDRDGVYSSHFSQHYGNKSVKVEVNSVEGVRPVSDDFVRMEMAKGYWLFLPVDHNTVEVTYEMQADPGGSLPAWVINAFLVDSPIKDMKSMKKRVMLEKYANKNYKFLVEY